MPRITWPSPLRRKTAPNDGPPRACAAAEHGGWCARLTGKGALVARDREYCLSRKRFIPSPLSGSRWSHMVGHGIEPRRRIRAAPGSKR